MKYAGSAVGRALISLTRSIARVAIAWATAGYVMGIPFLSIGFNSPRFVAFAVVWVVVLVGLHLGLDDRRFR